MSRINFAQLRVEDVQQGAFRPGLERFPSRGLEQIWDHLQSGDEKKSILDLGRASKANIEFYSHFRCTVVIEDWLSEYVMQRGIGSAECAENNENVTPRRVLFQLLEGVARKPFDAIFAWDIFNYLTPLEAKNFARALTEVAAPSALLLLHVSSVSRVPSRPRCYRLLSRTELSEEIFTSEAASCPRFSQRDLAQFFPRWKMTKSMQLRNSMQEHLLELNRVAISDDEFDAAKLPDDSDSSLAIRL